MQTRTGNFTIGFRRLGSDWQRELDGLMSWAKEAGFGAIDLGRDADTTAQRVLVAGLRIGSVDLPQWQGMISPDKGKRREAVQRNIDYIKACASAGPMNHFALMLPEKPDFPRAENFGYMVDSYSQLVSALEKHGARIVVEGWPGPGALCCTPEGYRALFKECPSEAIGINYDPSHLIRMGIDPLRFLRESGKRVYHIHGKDTELLSEGLYEYGNYQPPTFGEPVGFGGMHWRYAIPGHGQMRWIEAFRILKNYNYNGCVSVELEDANFNGTEQGEKLGLLQASHFLEGC